MEGPGASRPSRGAVCSGTTLTTARRNSSSSYRWNGAMRPACGSTEETRERLEPLHSKAGEPQFGPYFRIYVGNLPRKVDSSQLRQFFSKHGKVADVRVMYHIKTKRSRGFGFVTMATTVDDEPAHVIAMLDGQILDGRPLRVKFAGQK
nr:28 kDa ribonucleoprotein, chloroplastic-like isoform X2 [Setaria viridis]